MRVPDPKANTTTEAYLAYKAGYLEESELKPKLYKPDWHFDGWLAYWAGLTNDYPHQRGKNLTRPFIEGKYNDEGEPVEGQAWRTPDLIPVGAGEQYIFSNNGFGLAINLYGYNSEKEFVMKIGVGAIPSGSPFTVPEGIAYVAGWRGSGAPQAQLEKGDTITEYEPYNDTPEMLCDEEALVAYLSGVTDTYPEEIKDPYDVRIVGYLKHLASIRWPEPDYPVNNEEFYLSTMEPTHTSNPEPSADMELDTAEGKIISVEAYGDTKQQTYNGYNLIDLVPMTNTQPTRDQQCTFETVMDATLGRNVLHITGANNYPSISYQLPQRLESGKYYSLKFTYRSTVSGSPQSDTMWFAPNWSDTNYWDVLGSINSGRAKSGDGDTANSVGQSTTWKTTSRRFYVVPSQHSSASLSYTNICFSFGYNSNATKELWLADAELYEITEDEWNADTYTSKDYEPYTGGIPAPNPDYPQEIQTVTGEQILEIHGKNLLNLNFATGSSQGVTLVKNEDGIITATGTSLRTGSISISPASVGSLVLENGETYTQRFEVIDGELPEGVSVVPSFMDSNGNIRYNYFRNNSSVTTESEMTCNTYNFYWSAADINFNFSFRVWLEKNNDLSSEYSPYQSQSYPISLGSTELCKISDYQDYIYKGADGWYLHKEVGTNLVDVSSGVFKDYANADYISLRKPTDYAGNGNYDYYPILCTHAIVGTTPTGGWNSANGVNKAWLSAERTQIWVGFANGTTLETMQTMLNEMRLYYALDTPVDTKITDATLVGQLEALAGADTYNGKTFIKVTANDPNLPALLKVEAYKY